jgi:hypothetical protein
MIRVVKGETKVVSTVGKCIYCNSTRNLSDEHIIPYGLGGNIVLAKASCSQCAQMTSKFEMDIQRELFISLRSAIKLPSRKRILPSHFEAKVKFKSKSEEETASIPANYVPMFFPLYKPPAFFDGRPVIKGVQIDGIHTLLVDPIGTEKYLKDKGVERITYGGLSYKGQSFERLIAKVAYGHSVYHYGLEAIKDKIILPLIMGQDVEYNKYVGVLGPIKVNASSLHTTESVVRDDGLIIGYVQLFCNFCSPTYIVIVGRKATAD